MSDVPPESNTDDAARQDSADDASQVDSSDDDDDVPSGGVSGGDEVYASEVEGKQYRGTWYLPLRYDELDQSDESEEYPEQGTGGSFRLTDLPRVPRVGHVVGPSAIMLGASLGSGETLFWPVLTAQFGWTVFWAFIVGVFTQFVINTELQRWTLATGESIFRAFARVGTYWPWAFLVGGLVSLGWPGWAAGAAQVGATALGLSGSIGVFGFSIAVWKLIAVGLMAIIWLSYQTSSVMYNAVEVFQIGLLFVAIGATLMLVAVTGSWVEFSNVPDAAGAVGQLPEGLDIAVFLGGLAFAGAGGYLNLSQSLWMREKGYGMGNYQGRVKNPLRGDDPEPIERDGFTFRPTVTNLRRWRGWWRVVQLEHFLTFVLGLLIVAPALMSVAIKFAPGTTTDALQMWLGDVVPLLGPVGSFLVFAILFVALFTTEYAIVESFVRNSADALYEAYGRDAGWDLPKLFWRLLTAFCLWGIVIILVFTSPFEGREPFFFLVVGAAMSGVIMWPYTALVLVMNTTRLPEHIQPGWGRVVAMWWATGFYGYFSVLLIGTTLAQLGAGVFETAPVIVGSAPGGYLLWAAYLLVQATTVWKSVKGKREAAGTVADAEEATGWFS
ncbi:Nramp family divalent metal transporter [Haloferax sp. YSMS24]|uniref:Nramp family divalent metal transporter n=1 Tax=unclassified Haloferax TaxID=2625095 RepID=UPI00398C87ED